MVFENEDLFLDFIKKNKNDLTFVCIGTNKYIWDSFGPLLGDALKKIHGLKVFGDSKNEINGKNLDIIKTYRFDKNKTIYIDVLFCSAKDYKEYIKFQENTIYPAFGKISINCFNLLLAINTKLSNNFIERQVNDIAQKIKEAVE